MIALIFIFFTNVFGDGPPGLLESLDGLISDHKNGFNKMLSRVKGNPQELGSLKNVKSVTLHKNFITSILFYTDNNYLKIASENECKFLALIENGLAKIAKGQITHVVVDIQYTDNKSESALVTKKDYFDYVYKKKCFSNREMGTLFQKKEIAKTIDAMNFTVPQSGEQCKTIHSNWLKSPYLPYVCKIPDTIAKGDWAKLKFGDSGVTDLGVLRQSYLNGNFLKKNLSFFHRTYLSHLCSSLGRREDFCAKYLTDDIWNKIVMGEYPEFQMSYKCRSFLKKDKLSKDDLKSCALAFNKNPDICITQGADRFPALYPMTNCQDMSHALMKSRLHAAYKDCPGNIDNQAIVNVHRIVAHKKKLNILSDQRSCSSMANYSFAKLNLDKKNEKGWPLKICYFNRVIETEECFPYVPHYDGDDPLSETSVISKILYRMKGLESGNGCKIVDNKNYDPSRLYNEAGCFILYDPTACTTLSCNKEIIHDRKKIKGIKYVGTLDFDYFATSFGNEKFSANNLLLETFKSEKKIIHNLTILKSFLKNHKKGIVHGVGCAEDILPAIFKRHSFNECIPLPFIIDGVQKGQGTEYLVLRSAIDNIHAPRLVFWNRVFNGLANYRELFPLNKWTLYGIK